MDRDKKRREYLGEEKYNEVEIADRLNLLRCGIDDMIEAAGVAHGNVECVIIERARPQLEYFIKNFLELDKDKLTMQERYEILKLGNELNRERLIDALQLLHHWQTGDPEHHYEEFDADSLGCITRMFFEKIGAKFDKKGLNEEVNETSDYEGDLKFALVELGKTKDLLELAGAELKKAKDLMGLAVLYVDEAGDDEEDEAIAESIREFIA